MITSSILKVEVSPAPGFPVYLNPILYVPEIPNVFNDIVPEFINTLLPEEAPAKVAV